jgi:acylphosphatase
MAKLARRIIVHGMVQGVGFRYFVRRAGRRLDLTGNVCNLPDGTVEIVVEGSLELLEEFIGTVRKGPPAAQVERVDIHDIAVSDRYPTFLIEGW